MKSIPVDQNRIGNFKFIDVNPKVDQNKQQTANQDGIPQWKVQVLLTPADDSKATLEEITIANSQAPSITPMTELLFQDLTARFWEMSGRAGLALSASRVSAAPKAA